MDELTPFTGSPAPRRLRLVLLLLFTAALGGMAGAPAAAVLLFDPRNIGFVRKEAVIGIQVGAFLFIPVSLVLLALDARGRAPRTWVGWGLAGLLSGALGAGALQLAGV